MYLDDKENWEPIPPIAISSTIPSTALHCFNYFSKEVMLRSVRKAF